VTTVIDVESAVQLGGVAVALWLSLNTTIKLFRDWRGGSPELRVLREQLRFSNDQTSNLLERIVRLLGGSA
jgi:hypothetical protein